MRTILQILILVFALQAQGCRLGGNLNNSTDTDAGDGFFEGDATSAAQLTPTNFGYKNSVLNLAIGFPIDPNTPSYSGPAVDFSANLPPGLSIDPADGTISGTPTTLSDQQTYTISGMGSDVQDSEASILIRVVDAHYVNSTSNTGWDSVDDGVCDDGGGRCTLRAAVEENNNTALAVKPIVLPFGTYTLGSAIDIQRDMQIYGEENLGVVIQGHGFGVSGAIDVTFEGLTFRGINSGGVAGAAITTTDNDNSQVTVNFCRFVRNQTTTNGGAIYLGEDNDLILRNSIFSNNFAGLHGGAIFVEDNASFTIESSDFEGNVCAGFLAAGGAIFTEQGSTGTIRSSEFNHNSVTDGTNTPQGGGAVFSQSDNLLVDKSSFSSNYGGSTGGAIWHAQAGSLLRIRNSNFYQNWVDTVAGAVASLNGTTNIKNSTFLNNRSLSALGGGAIQAANGTTTLTSNIFMGNRDTSGLPDTCNDATGTFASGGDNIADTDDADCSFSGASGDVARATDLELRPPEDVGGTIDSIVIRENSAAVDMGGICPTGISTDIRGYDRDSNCDSGAFEIRPGEEEFPHGLDYGRSWVTIARNTTMEAMSPSLLEGRADIYRIYPGLPAGMRINPTSGEISGTPTEVTPRHGIDYTIYAINLSTGAVTSGSLTIRVLSNVFVVDSNLDEDDTNINGDCESDLTPGACTLRAALAEAAARPDVRIMIRLESGIGSITLASTLNVSANVDIIGAGAGQSIVTGVGMRGIQNVGAAFEVRMADFSIKGFDQNLVVNAATTYLSAMRIEDGIATTSGSGLISVGNTDLYIENSVFRNNDTSAPGSCGAALESTGTGILMVKETLFYENDCTSGTARGGAVYIEAGSQSQFINNVFYDNSSSDEGGAFAVMNAGNPVVFLSGNIFAQNSAINGGAIVADRGRLTLTNNTFYSNTVTGDGAAIWLDGGSMFLHNNVFEDNLDTGVDDDCHINSGTMTSFGGNMTDADFVGCSLAGATGDIRLTDGGTIESVVGGVPRYDLDESSPLIDAADSAGCAYSEFDGSQRMRLVDGDGDGFSDCDIGAIEYQN